MLVRKGIGRRWWIEKGRKYSTAPEDIAWASRGLMAQIRNGVTVPTLQQILIDIGLEFFKVLPLGVDKIFSQAVNEQDFMSLYNKASEFFNVCVGVVRGWGSQ